MEIELNNVLSKLTELQISLRKLGSVRRLQNVGIEKINEAKELYAAYLNYLDLMKSSVSNIEVTEQFSEYIFDVLCEKIDKVYNKILEYSVVKSTVEIRKQVKMAEKFDLKEAGSLIPTYDGKDETLERIIEGIEMMDSLLKNADNKKLLISYVLKTRLNKNARIKLNTEYDTVSGLIFDIKKYLLPKKSANSLLLQLNNIAQNNMSITEYGDKIEDLFTSLTITQADNNPKACEILRPLNETLAIKKFADGLRNRRLGTIIAARNYKELKEAVQAAKDEDNSQPTPVVMSMRGNGRGYQVSGRGNRGYRGRWNSRGYHNQHYRGNYWAPTYNRYRGNYQQRAPGRAARGVSTRSRGTRGRGNTSTSGQQQQNVYTATTSTDEPNLSEFFRP